LLLILYLAPVIHQGECTKNQHFVGIVDWFGNV